VKQFQGAPNPEVPLLRILRLSSFAIALLALQPSFAEAKNDNGNQGDNGNHGNGNNGNHNGPSGAGQPRSVPELSGSAAAAGFAVIAGAGAIVLARRRVRRK